MGKKKGSNKIDYDEIYPPLNQSQNSGSPDDKPRQTALQAVMAQAEENHHIIIHPADRRFKNGDPKLDETIQNIEKIHGVNIKYNISNLGSLYLKILTEDPAIENTVKFLLIDSLSLQTKFTMKLDERFLKRYVDKRNQNRILANRHALIRVDFPKGILAIEGGKESVRQVAEDIEDYVSWNTNSASGSLDILRVYHKFIRGINSENLNCIVESSGKFVHISFSDDADVVCLSGNKRCVEKARENVLQYYENLKNSLKRVSFKLSQIQKKQLTNRLPENIFEAQGVSTYFSKIDETLFCFDAVGEEEKLAFLITLINDVIGSFSSKRIYCPYWICRHLSSMTEFFDALASLFPDSVCTIYSVQEFIEITYSSDKIEDASVKISSIINDISSTLSYEVFTISEDLWKILDGRQHRIRLHEIEQSSMTNFYFETNVEKLSIIKDPINKPDILCTIVGESKQVEYAKELLEELKDYFDSFISMVIEIPNHLHRYLIGSKGKTLKAIMKSSGPDCEVSFGKEENDLDSCFVRGPPTEVDAVVALLRDKTTEFDNLHHLLKIPVPSSVMPILYSDRVELLESMNKNGPIEFVDFNPTKDYIVVVAKKDIALLCEIFLKDRVLILSESIEKEIKVPVKLQQFLSEFSEDLVKLVCEESGGGLHISLSQITQHDYLKLTGPSTNVNRALQFIKRLGSESEFSYERIKIPKTIFPGIKSSISSITSRCKIYVLFGSIKKSESILLIGKVDDVNKIKKAINEKIYILQNTVEKSINIKAHYKKEFLKKQNGQPTLVQKLSSEHNNVRIILGQRQPNSDVVTLTVRGFKDDVDSLFIVINDLIGKFNSRIERSIDFKISHLNSILSYTRFLLKTTMAKYDVVISISEDYYSALRERNLDGTCTVHVRGMPDNVEQAVSYLNDWEVVTEKIFCPFSIQRTLYHHKNSFNEISNSKMITIQLGLLVKPAEEVVIVTGLKPHVQDSYEELYKIFDNHYTIELNVNRQHFTRLIGKKGSFVNKFNADHSVVMSVLFDNSEDLVTISGRKEHVDPAAAELKSIISNWESVVVKEFEFDARIRNQLVGQDGANLRKIGNDCNVSLRIIAPNDRTTSVRHIRATGLPENIEKAFSALKINVDELMEEFNESHIYKPQADQYYQLDMNSISTLVYGDSKKRNKKKISKSPKPENEEDLPLSSQQQNNNTEVLHVDSV